MNDDIFFVPEKMKNQGIRNRPRQNKALSFNDNKVHI